ncbi:MAG TPA: TauD/TfdA family dioxygenase [Candidatus Lustribacter sp.]
MKIRPFDAALGAEVAGIDCREITAEEAPILREAFARYHVLVVHGDVMPDDDLVAFGACFGNLERAKFPSAVTTRPEVMVISNVRQNGELVGKLPDGEVEWHFDRMHQRTPNIAAVLHAVEIPSWGGETIYANIARAYESLPAATKRKIEGLTAANLYDYDASSRDSRVLTATTPRAVHPVVKRLPGSGEKTFWVSPLMTERIVELAEDEGNALLAELFEAMAKPEFSYEHRWTLGDTLIWDNRCVAHRRNDFDPNQRRLLKRVTVRDDAAVTLRRDQ